jgi:hypothetical protein
LWNPHSTIRIYCKRFGLFKITAGAAQAARFRRSTARGTPGSTHTSDIDNHAERAIAPPSGALLDVAAFTVQPTMDASEIVPIRPYVLDSAGNFHTFRGKGFCIPPGTGLALSQVEAQIWPASEISFEWSEESI